MLRAPPFKALSAIAPCFLVGLFLAPPINQADPVRRVSHTLETMAGSPDRLLGLLPLIRDASLCTHPPLRRVGAVDVAFVQRFTPVAS